MKLEDVLNKHRLEAAVPCPEDCWCWAAAAHLTEDEAKTPSHAMVLKFEEDAKCSMWMDYEHRCRSYKTLVRHLDGEHRAGRIVGYRLIAVHEEHLALRRPLTTRELRKRDRAAADHTGVRCRCKQPAIYLDGDCKRRCNRCGKEAPK